MSIWSKLYVLNRINKDNYCLKYQLNKDKFPCSVKIVKVTYITILYHKVLCMSKMLSKTVLTEMVIYVGFRILCFLSEKHEVQFSHLFNSNQK